MLGVVYNLACCEALSGSARRRSSTCGRAVELDPKIASHARSDTDLESIRDGPRFVAAVG